MRLLVVLLALPAVLHAQAISSEDVLYQSQCNYVTLVKCFIDILDEWAWALYELKDNVVTVTEEQCAHLTRLEQCIKDRIDADRIQAMGVTDDKHRCKHSEIVEVSNTVSDLLTHRRNAGSFLKSYYLLTYACSAEGQQILKEHRECLKVEKIGNMTLTAGTYMNEQLLDTLDDDDVCDKVNLELDKYMQSTSSLCKKEAAATLMCKSLINMFKGLHADKLDTCPFKCNIPKQDEEETDTNELKDTTNPEQVANDQEALNKSTSMVSQFLSLMLAFAVLSR